MLISTLCVSFCFVLIADKIFHLDVHYVCYTMLVQRFVRRLGGLQITLLLFTGVPVEHT